MERRKLKRKVQRGISHIFAILMFAFFYIPVIVMVVFSFNNVAKVASPNQRWIGFTTKWYSVLMNDTALWKITCTTLLVAIITTVISVIIGTIGAVGLKKWDFKWKKIITTSLYVPIVIPEIVLAVALMLVLKAVGIKLGLIPMIIGNVTLTLPYVFISVKTRLVGMDPSIEEASLDLGADRVYTFLHVTLPSIMPGIVSGGFLAFTLALGDLIVLNFLADVNTVTLSVKIYSMIKRGISPEINALATIILFVLLLLAVLASTITLLKAKIENKKETELAKAVMAEENNII